MRPGQTLEDFLKSKEGLKLSEAYFLSILEYAVEEGRIDPKGKSEKEIAREFIKILERLKRFTKNPNGEVIFITDYRSSLLQQARLFLRARERQLACLFYATWVEHWLNWLIVVAGKRRGLNDEELLQIIRDTPFRGKLTWMFPLLGLRHLPANHKNVIFKITDLRNGFVHYKWKGKGEEADELEERELTQSLAAIEKTIRYLHHYGSKYIFHRKKKVLRKIVRLRE